MIVYIVFKACDLDVWLSCGENHSSYGFESHRSVFVDGVYPDVGHEITPEIKADVLSFFSKHL